MDNIPCGYCQCGCGEKTKIAPRTQTSRGWVKGEPMKYIHRHATTAKLRVDFGVNQNDGLCHCECGESAPIAKGTTRELGIVRGEPLRYINGHHNMLPETYTAEDRGYDTPCWIWRNEASSGYGYIGRNGRFIYAHRYFYEREHGHIPEGCQLHHKCEIRNCVRLSHLEPLSMVDHQRLHTGTRLTMAKAREARRLVLVCGMQRKEVAELFGVSSDVIEIAVNGKTWRE